MCLTVGRQSRDHGPLSREPSVSFYKKFPNCLKRPKNVVWQPADGRVTSTTVAWPFSDFFQNFPKSLETSKNVVRQSADGRVTSTTVAWPFSDFFQNFPKSLETSKKRCLTVGRQSRDLRPRSRDRSATFFKKFSNCLKRAKNVVWQSADGRVTSTTVAWQFSDFFQNSPKSLETSKKRCLTVGRRSRDLRPLSRDRSATFFKIFPNRLKRPKRRFFKIFPNRLKRPKNVAWQSADGRVTSDHCRVTVQRLFSKSSQIAWNVQKTLFDSRPTVAWPPTTVAWPFSDFFQNYPNRLKRAKNVVWQSADGRVTSDHCRVTVQRLFSNFFLIAWNVQKTLFDSRPTVAWPQPLSRDSSATFFKILPNRLKRPKNVVWQSVDGRVTSDHCRVTVQRLFSKFSQIAWNVQKNVVWQSADGRVTSDHCRVTVQRLFSKFSQIAWNVQKRCSTVGRRSRDLNHCRVTVQRLFSKFSQIAWNVQKRCLTVGGRSRNLNHCRVTVQRLFSKFSQIAWNVQKTLFDSRPTVAWPPTTVTWPFSDFFQKIF